MVHLTQLLNFQELFKVIVNTVIIRKKSINIHFDNSFLCTKLSKHSNLCLIIYYILLLSLLLRLSTLLFQYIINDVKLPSYSLCSVIFYQLEVDIVGNTCNTEIGKQEKSTCFLVFVVVVLLFLQEVGFLSKEFKEIIVVGRRFALSP